MSQCFLMTLWMLLHEWAGEQTKHVYQVRTAWSRGRDINIDVQCRLFSKWLLHHCQPYLEFSTLTCRLIVAPVSLQAEQGRRGTWHFTVVFICIPWWLMALDRLLWFFFFFHNLSTSLMKYPSSRLGYFSSGLLFQILTFRFFFFEWS